MRISLTGISLAVLTASIAILSCCSAAQAQQKGVAGQEANAAKVGATWCYNWGSSNPGDVPGGVEFVPMWWGFYGATQAQDNSAAQALRNGGMTRLLTFNEPDNSTQSNLSVSSALQGYAEAANACNAVGMSECISPAGMDDQDSWMQSFMSSVSSQRLRCDAVAVHAYQSNASSFLSYIDSVHNMYGKKLWITEFAPTDWASPTNIGVDACVNYINSVLPGLQSRSSYVERYSWYCGTTPNPNVLGTAALFNTDGTLTEVGDRYRSPGAGFTPAGYTWRLVNRGDGKALDNYGNTTNGSGVFQYDLGPSTNQRWRITASGSSFKLQCVTGGLYLDTVGNTANGSTVGQWSGSGSWNQLWNINSVGNGYFTITNVASGKCLDDGGQSSDGARMEQWNLGGSWNQEWMLIGY